ncbi:hypothetical protein OPQ81_011746 [Rhizoctonia solani]|nr:hypothetical protein OPQ81_011746 [Rhizoctonia solani]
MENRLTQLLEVSAHLIVDLQPPASPPPPTSTHRSGNPNSAMQLPILDPQHTGSFNDTYSHKPIIISRDTWGAKLPCACHLHCVGIPRKTIPPAPFIVLHTSHEDYLTIDLPSKAYLASATCNICDTNPAPSLAPNSRTVPADLVVPISSAIKAPTSISPPSPRSTAFQYFSPTTMANLKQLQLIYSNVNVLQDFESKGYICELRGEDFGRKTCLVKIKQFVSRSGDVRCRLGRLELVVGNRARTHK